MAWELARALVESGIEVEVHTSNQIDSGDIVPPGVTSYLENRLQVHHYKSREDFISFKPVFSRDCDVLHIMGFHRLLVPRVMVANRGWPIILQPHGDIYMVSGEPAGLKRSVRSFIDSTFYPRLVRRFSLVLCLKEEERDSMVRLGVVNSRCVLMRSPIRMEMFHERSEELVQREPDLFVCVCRIVRIKRVQDAIQALKYVPEARLKIIGPWIDQTYVDELFKLARQLKVWDRIEFIGGVPNSEIGIWYRRAAGVILCTQVEGQGLVLAEAISQGSIPIVARGAADEFIRATECGLLYEFGDVQDLAHQMNEVMVDHGVFEESLVNGRRFVENELSPGAVAGKLAEIYRELLH